MNELPHHVTRACTIIAYDNGCVSRDRTEAMVLAAMQRTIVKYCTPQEIQAAEGQLSGFTDEQIEVAAAGEEQEQDALGLTEATDKVLDHAFEFEWV